MIPAQSSVENTRLFNTNYICTLLRRFVLSATITAMLIAVTSIFMAIFQTDSSHQYFRQTAVTEAVFFFSALALFLSNFRWSDAKTVPARYSIFALAGFIATIALLSVFMLGMSFQSCCSFIVVAVIICFINIESVATQRSAQFLSAAVIGLAAAVWTAHAYGFHPTPLAERPSAFCFILLGTAGLLSRPSVRPAAIILSDTAGGATVRRVLPMSCLLSLLVGFIYLLNPAAELFILVTLVSLILPLLIWIAAVLLERAELQKKDAFEETRLLDVKLNAQLAELLASYNQVSEALKTRSEFLAKMSHELRTPLSAIISSNEILLCTNLSAEQVDLAEITVESGRNLLRLIGDVLDFSKLEAHKLRIDNSEFDLLKVITTAVDYFRRKASCKGLTLVTEISADVPRIVNCDPDRLRQVLINLIDNAIKFTEHGNITLFTSVICESQKREILFEVKDTGIGIPASFCDRLFQPFVQADGSMTRKYGGSGLGLSICKSLSELMGGRIGVKSSIGEGASFWFTVPLLRCTTSLPVIASAGLRIVGKSNPTDVILIAEDNPVNAKISTLQLRRLGYLFDVVSNGKQAVEAASKGEYALILMDIQMPEMDGLEAARVIRVSEEGTGRHVPIVALTAHATPTDKDRCIAAGMDAYLQKPTGLPELAAVVQRLIGARTVQTSERLLVKT